MLQCCDALSWSGRATSSDALGRTSLTTRNRLSLLGFVLLSPWATPATADDSPHERVRWVNSRLVGSPEPPPPYTVEKTFTKIEWNAPMYLIPEPGTDKLWVVLQGGDKL